MESAMRGWLAASTLSVALLALPATASAANIGLVPHKSCYRAGEQVFLGGTGFTANTPAEVTLDRKSLGQTIADAQGVIRGVLSLGLITGERNRLLAVTDQANATNFATLTLRATGVAVGVKPKRAGPGRAVRIKARGFTDSKRLYAHIRRGRFHRNVGIGRLRGACRKLSRRKRVFSAGTRPGVYNVQFDGKRRYSKKTRPRILYRVTIFRRLVRRSSASSAAAESWVRLPQTSTSG
jgi:hypothetical protein